MIFDQCAVLTVILPGLTQSVRQYVTAELGVSLTATKIHVFSEIALTALTGKVNMSPTEPTIYVNSISTATVANKPDIYLTDVPLSAI